MTVEVWCILRCPQTPRQSGPPDIFCISVGPCAAVFAARSRPRLRAGIPRDGEMDGHSRSPDCTPESLAEPPSRATDRIDSSFLCRTPAARHLTLDATGMLYGSLRLMVGQLSFW